MCKCSLYHLVCLLTGGKESVFFLFQNQKYLQATVMNTKSKTSNNFSKLISPFWKPMRRGRISFPKRKTRSTPICKCTIFFQLSQNISKSNLKLPFFYFDWDSSKFIRDERTWRSWKLVKPIRKPMSYAQWWYPSLSKKISFLKEGKRSLLCK